MEPNNASAPAMTAGFESGQAVEVMDAPAPDLSPETSLASENEILGNSVMHDEAQADSMLGSLLEGTAVVRSDTYMIGEGGAGVDALLSDIETSGNEVFSDRDTLLPASEQKPDALSVGLSENIAPEPVRNPIDSSEHISADPAKETAGDYPDTISYLLNAEDPGATLEALRTMDDATLLRTINAIEYGTPAELAALMRIPATMTVERSAPALGTEALNEIPHYQELKKILAESPERIVEAGALAGAQFKPIETKTATDRRETGKQEQHEAMRAFEMPFAGAVLYQREPETPLADTKIMLVNHGETWQLPAHQIRAQHDTASEVTKMLAYQTGVKPDAFEAVLKEKEASVGASAAVSEITPEYFLAKKDTAEVPRPESGDNEARWFTLAEIAKNELGLSEHDALLINKAASAIEKMPDYR